MTNLDAHTDAPRKPRLALMGEFSAGKSTLSNLLLGANPLPTRVTATRLPPVWITYGADAATLVGHDGGETPFDLADLDSVDLDRTRLIRLSLESDMLQLCDLIDMPGISDPNMSAEVWQSVFSQADCVVWCTHATQAWRQSEAATWESITEHTNGDNLLLITQFDKLTNERDRARVLARVRRETEDRFAAVYPVSLIEALNAGEDVDKWASSGAGRFTEHLVDVLMNPTDLRDRAALTPVAQSPEPVAETPDVPGMAEAEAEQDDAMDGPRVTPKRVRAKSGGARPERLSRQDIDSLLNAEV